jgi:hypothetical protein
VQDEKAGKGREIARHASEISRFITSFLRVTLRDVVK